jgi:hypothetical protein
MTILIGKLDRVGENVEKNLLNSLGVGANTEMIKAFIISLYLN